MPRILGHALMTLGLITLVACGGGSSGTTGGGSDGGVSASVSPTTQTQIDAAISQTITQALTSNTGSTGTGTSKGWAGVAKSGTQLKATETFSLACGRGGSVAVTVTDATTSADGSSFSGTISVDANACAADISYPLAGGGTCAFSSVVDGAMNCTLNGSVSGETFTVTAHCLTSPACGAMNVRINTTDYTYGFDLTSRITGTEDNATIAVSGSACVNGSTSLFSESTTLDLSDLDATALAETCPAS